jgi:tetratricopeptide (TPR) repeat protein
LLILFNNPLLYLGIELYNLGKYEDAIINYDRAIKINPNDSDYFYNKGK